VGSVLNLAAQNTRPDTPCSVCLQRQTVHASRAFVVRSGEPGDTRPQEQEEEAETRVTGKTVPHVVPSVYGDRSSDSQSLSRVNVRMDKRSQAFVACMMMIPGTVVLITCRRVSV